MLTDIENYWSRELRSDVEVIPTRDAKYAVYLDRSYFSEYKSLPELEDALGKMYVLTETDGY